MALVMVLYHPSLKFYGIPPIRSTVQERYLFDEILVILPEHCTECVRGYVMRLHPFHELSIKCFAFFVMPLKVALKLFAVAVVGVFAGQLADISVTFLAKFAHSNIPSLYLFYGVGLIRSIPEKRLSLCRLSLDIVIEIGIEIVNHAV